MRLVLDTNVVMDLLHFRDAAVQSVADALAAGNVTCLADATTLDELERVVGYPEFHLAADAQAALLARYRALVTVMPPGEAPRLPRCQDPDDQKFLELAARAGADLLVSKDKALLHLKGRQGLAFQIAPPAVAGDFLSNRRR